MCNRFVQDGAEIRPGQRCVVKMRGPGGEWEMDYDGAVFGGPAKSESRNYWLKREKAEEVRVPGIERFGEKNKATGEQNWEETPAGASLDGLLLPLEEGKSYRLLKIVTQPATPYQLASLGNDRAPIVRITPPASDAARCTEPDIPHEFSMEKPTINEDGELVGTDFACSRCGITIERFMAVS